MVYGYKYELQSIRVSAVERVGGGGACTPSIYSIFMGISAQPGNIMAVRYPKTLISPAHKHKRPGEGEGEEGEKEEKEERDPLGSPPRAGRRHSESLISQHHNDWV